MHLCVYIYIFKKAKKDFTAPDSVLATLYLSLRQNFNCDVNGSNASSTNKSKDNAASMEKMTHNKLSFPKAVIVKLRRKHIRVNKSVKSSSPASSAKHKSIPFIVGREGANLNHEAMSWLQLPDNGALSGEHLYLQLQHKKVCYNISVIAYI